MTKSFKFYICTGRTYKKDIVPLFLMNSGKILHLLQSHLGCILESEPRKIRLHFFLLEQTLLVQLNYVIKILFNNISIYLVTWTIKRSKSTIQIKKSHFSNTYSETSYLPVTRKFQHNLCIYSGWFIRS